MDYFDFTRNIKIEIDRFISSEHNESIFDEFIVKYSKIKTIEEFVLFLERFVLMKVESLKRDKCLFILRNILFSENILEELIFSLSEHDEKIGIELNSSSMKEIFVDKFITYLVSLPEMIVNLYGYRVPEEFCESLYIEKLCETLKIILERISATEKTDSHLISSFLRTIIGRLCLKHYSNIVWSNILYPIVLKYDKIAYLQQILFEENFLGNANHSNYFESILKMIFLSNSHSYKLFSRLLNHEYFQKLKANLQKSIFNDKFEYFITRKLIWNCSLDDAKLLNLFSFLEKENFLILDKITCDCLHEWSTKECFKTREYEDHLQLSKCLILLSKVLFDKKNKENVNESFLMKFHQKISTGTQFYLLSTYLPFRSIGLLTTEICLKILSQHLSDELSPPVFEEDKHFVDYEIIKSLAEIDMFKFSKDSENLEFSFVLFKVDEKKEEIMKINDNSQESSRNITEIQQLDSDDDEDDLVPMNGSVEFSEDRKFRMMPRDYRTLKELEAESLQKFLVYDNSKQTPIYLQDLIDGLVDDKNPEWTEKCLLSAEKIIRNNFRNPFRLNAAGKELAKILFHLNDETSLKTFEQLRCNSLKALTVGSPKLVGEYLSSQFWKPNLSISNRMNALNVLVGASQELSQIAANALEWLNDNEKITNSEIMEANFKNSSDKMFEIEYFNLENETIDNSSWKAIINKRIQEKSRYFAPETLKNQQKINKISSNAFVPVAGYFFFPLLKNPSSQTDVHLKLNEDDAYLLEHLLYSLGIMVQNCFNHPEVQIMSKELLLFMKQFLGHGDRNVQLALLQVFRTILLSNSVNYLLNELDDVIEEYSKWLLAIQITNKDHDCLLNSRLAQNELLKLFSSNQIEDIKKSNKKKSFLNF